jgi:hypothetical protein
LDFGGWNLSLLCALLNLGDKGFLLLLQLHSLLVELSDGFIQQTLVLSKTLRGRDALPESPF